MSTGHEYNDRREFRMDHLAEQLAEQNKDTYNKTVDYYASEFYLDPAELQFLHMFRGRWHQMKMIDIG